MAPSDGKPDGKTTRVTVVGWSACGYFQKAVHATSEASQHNPQLKVTHVELPDRESYKTWLATEKPKLKLSGGDTHTSSPLVYLNENEFLGGCDAILAYLNDKSSKTKGQSKGSKGGKWVKLIGLNTLGALPLVLSSAIHEPMVMVTGLVLQALLTRDTITPSPPSAHVDQAREEAALKNLVITSDHNRLLRGGMGACHLYSAFQMAGRWSTVAVADKQTAQGAIASIPGSLGLFGVIYVGLIWMISGYYGQ